MELEMIMLSEISQTQKDDTACFLSYLEASSKGGEKDLNIKGRGTVWREEKESKREEEYDRSALYDCTKMS
jgi:hypothetical protein